MFVKNVGNIAVGMIKKFVRLLFGVANITIIAGNVKEGVRN